MACNSSKNKAAMSKFDFESEYANALHEIKNGDFYTASEKLENINTNTTKFNDKVMILLAFSHYKRGSYLDSLNAINVFEKIFPMHNEMVYMKYLEILNYFKRLEHVGKGMDLAQKGYELCDKFLKRYDNSVYYGDVLDKFGVFKNYVVANELEIVRFDLSRNNFVPALKRLDYIRDNFNDSLYRDEVYFRYIEIYKYIGHNFDKNLINEIKSQKWKDLVEKL